MSAERGSVLLEALVSTTVVAAVMATMLTAIGQADDRRREVEARREALMIARSELAAVGSAIPLRSGEVQGVDGDFAWSVRIEPGLVGALGASLAAPPSTVTVTVRAASGGENLAILRTLRVAS